MKCPRLPFVSVFSACRALTLLSGFLYLQGGGAALAQENQIFSFTYAEGELPRSGLLLDAKGNLYGAASGGGTHGRGDVFELVRETNGSWKFEVLHPFGSVIEGSVDGGEPRGDLIWGPGGTLIGTTYSFGKHGSGTVFELTPQSNGQWTEKILYDFGASAQDGKEPAGGVVRDKNGHLYGTTYVGGKYDGGTVFELIPAATGSWTEKILHNFEGFLGGTDGYSPVGSLVLDPQGHLYGATFFGGKNTSGVVYEVTIGASGEGTEKVIYPLGAIGGIAGNPATSNAGLVLDGKGNLYGTSTEGGQELGNSCSCGTVFELSPGPGGTWKETTIHHFIAAKTDGSDPRSSLIFDTAGNLYGTTYNGGAYGRGSAFELTPGAAGKWTEKLLSSFGRSETDGSFPIARLVRDSAENLYGVTYMGGKDNFGAIFEIPHAKAAAKQDDVERESAEP